MVGNSYYMQENRRICMKMRLKLFNYMKDNIKNIKELATDML